MLMAVLFLTIFMKFLSNTLKRKSYVTDFHDMSSYGSLMGLLGMNIEKNLKHISKYKQNYTVLFT